MNMLRLAYIEALIITEDSLNATDIMRFFGIKRAAASRDIRHYKDNYPGNIEYCTTTKRYRTCKTFEAKVLQESAYDFLAKLKPLEYYFQ